jgi:hypothetical protein
MNSANPLLTNGNYSNHSHYVMGAVTFRPVKRVTTLVGYSITNVDGETPLFSNLQPGGHRSTSIICPWQISCSTWAIIWPGTPGGITTSTTRNPSWVSHRPALLPRQERNLVAALGFLIWSSASGRLRPPQYSLAEMPPTSCVIHVTPAGEVTHCPHAHPARTIAVQLNPG